MPFKKIVSILLIALLVSSCVGSVSAKNKLHVSTDYINHTDMGERDTFDFHPTDVGWPFDDIGNANITNTVDVGWPFD